MYRIQPEKLSQICPNECEAFFAELYLEKRDPREFWDGSFSTNRLVFLWYDVQAAFFEQTGMALGRYRGYMTVDTVTEAWLPYLEEY